jgi:hypothetical protein
MQARRHQLLGILPTKQINVAMYWVRPEKCMSKPNGTLRKHKQLPNDQMKIWTMLILPTTKQGRILTDKEPPKWIWLTQTRLSRTKIKLISLPSNTKGTPEIQLIWLSVQALMPKENKMLLKETITIGRQKLYEIRLMLTLPKWKSWKLNPLRGQILESRTSQRFLKISKTFFQTNRTFQRRPKSKLIDRKQHGTKLVTMLTRHTKKRRSFWTNLMRENTKRPKLKTSTRLPRLSMMLLLLLIDQVQATSKVMWTKSKKYSHQLQEPLLTPKWNGNLLKETQLPSKSNVMLLILAMMY